MKKRQKAEVELATDGHGFTRIDLRFTIDGLIKGKWRILLTFVGYKCIKKGG